MPSSTPEDGKRGNAMAVAHPRAGDVEIGLIGLPRDGGTSNRSGARHAPRVLRDASAMLRARHPVSGMRPFAAANCAVQASAAVTITSTR